MPYELTTSAEESLIQLVYSGTVFLAERKTARDEVFRLSREEGLYRVLVDMRHSDIQMTRSDAMQFAMAFKAVELPPNYRLACLVGQENDCERLVELLIAQDHINVKYFYSGKDARQWLLAV